ncbi:MAG TPA: methylated-DNA--[protein]-cysteine S-methyltransferase [Acidimicrobiia bacterium]|nr:methylated-DNA--[protein]-cysteine S-methyltransferase [Acidimicrobiia bacterium]
MTVTECVDDPRWTSVLARDERSDFVYAVRTTRVYCRPSCPSRRPRPDNVAFFARGADAEEHGYRACRRCRPDAPATNERVARVEAACRRFDDGEGVRVADVAAALGVSADGLRRDFQRVLGVSPKQYADGRRVERLRAELREGRDVTGALYTAGYGSSSRLYEQSDARLGMTPASYGAGGAGASIAFTVSSSPLGALIVATTARGVCWIALGAEAVALEDGLRVEFPAAAAIARDDDALAPVVAEVLRRIDGEVPREELTLDVRGTAFQVRVWQELQRIPRGETRSYGEVAAAVGVRGGARAVGAACGSNPVSVVVPCHRVVTATGGLGGYAWGVDAKEALLERERARGSELRQPTSRTRPVSTS